MTTSVARVSKLLRWVSLAATIWMFAGCASPEGARPSPRDRKNVQIPLEARTSLFDGAVEMRVTLAPFFVLSPEGGRVRGGPGGEFRSPGRPDGEFGPPAMEQRGARGPASLPPATHRVRVSFTNLRKERVQFDVYEVRSLLGVFGVRPNRLVLEPEQTIEIDPMRASVGESFASMDVTVNVRHAGKTENVTLHLVPTP